MNCIKCNAKIRGKHTVCSVCFDKFCKSDDYQDMVNKDTTKFLRRQLGIWDIRNCSIQCLLCKDIIRSKHSQHYVKCKCCACAVAWGSKYVRIMWEKYKILSEPFDDINDIQIFEEKNNF